MEEYYHQLAGPVHLNQTSLGILSWGMPKDRDILYKKLPFSILISPIRYTKICPRAEIIHHVSWRIIVNIWPYKGSTFQGLIFTRVSVENHYSSDNLSKLCTLWPQYSKMNSDFVSFNITPYYSSRKGHTT